MKNTIKRLPFVLAFAITLSVASCSDETFIKPSNTDDKNLQPPPPPPPGSNGATAGDSTLIG